MKKNIVAETASAGIKKSQMLKDLPAEKKPREKFLKEGSDKMELYELIAIFLRTGMKKVSVIDLSKALLKKYKKLEYLIEAPVRDLMEIKGIGLAKAAQLAACFELAKRYSREKAEVLKEKLNKEGFKSPEEIYNFLKFSISDFKKEHFYVLTLDIRNRMIDMQEISTGTLSSSLVHPRETYLEAIRKHSASIVVAHNHPSGDVQPSEDDIKITKRLAEAGKIIGIELIDHIIFTEDKFYSFKEEGTM